VLGSLLVILVLFGLFVVYPAYGVYSQAKVAKAAALELQAALAARDLEAANESLAEVGTAVAGVGHAYRRLEYLRFVPLLNRYYRDGWHLLSAASFALEGGEIAADALVPLADLLGLPGDTGQPLTFGQQVSSLGSVLPQIAPQIDAAAARLSLVRAELNQIEPGRYPEEIRGIKVRFWLEEVQQLLSELDPLFEEARTVVEVLPSLLGVPERTYLVLLQNDAELRATGGFITALGFITVRGGQVVGVEVHNVGFGTNNIPAEPTGHPIARYLHTPGLLFHDTNYTPDFRISAERVLEFWSRGRGLPPVDSIIAITAGAAARILEFTGPIVVPGYDQDLAGLSRLPASCRSGGAAFTSENLVCRLEYWVEAAGTDKGEIIGELAEVLIEKLSSSSAETWAQIAELAFGLLHEKGVLLYSADPVEQALFEKLDFAGRIKEFDGDYLHINDSNLGGKKTDMFMQETVEQSLVKLEDGRWRKTVKIDYYNPQPYDNWLSANYKDWLRLYVPKGSELVGVEGVYIDISSWEELGKTVFSAFFYLWPQQERTITFIYDLPSSVVGAMEETGSYELLVQKQPGTNIGLVRVEVGGKIETFDLETDREVGIAL